MIDRTNKNPQNFYLANEIITFNPALFRLLSTKFKNKIKKLTKTLAKIEKICIIDNANQNLR